MDNNYLAHYGVLGMKWGVRKSGKKSSSRRKSKKRKKYGTEERGYNQSAKTVQKNMYKMNDAELQKAINRLNMQKAVNRMNPTTFEKGKNAIKTYSAVLGMTIGAVMLTKKASSGISKVPTILSNIGSTKIGKDILSNVGGTKIGKDIIAMMLAANIKAHL